MFVLLRSRRVHTEAVESGEAIAVINIAQYVMWGILVYVNSTIYRLSRTRR
jgi:hypothetical protein